jgi:hypothetical protein
MAKMFWGYVAALVIAALVMGIAARAADPPRWALIKVYAKMYSEETACMLDLHQAAQMSPPGTRFKCERISQ